MSAVASYLIREPARAPARDRSEVRLSAGLRVLFGNRILAPLISSATVASMAGAIQGPLIVLYLIRELHRSPSFVGVQLTTFGVAAVLGTLVRPAPWCRRVGIGRAYLSGAFLASLTGVALFTGRTPMILLGQVFAGPRHVPVRRPPAHPAPGGRAASPSSARSPPAGALWSSAVKP